MWYQLEENNEGDFVDQDGKRYEVNECNAAYTPQGVNVGYTFFETREQMCAEWQLNEIIKQTNNEKGNH